MSVLANSGAVAIDAIVVAAMLIPLPILGYLCWIFWKAKKREDEERRTGS